MSDSATPAPSGRAAVFAAGHLGELTWQIPVELVDAVLAETRTVQRRLRALPSRVGVYCVRALCLCPGLGYRQVWAKRTASIPPISATVCVAQEDSYTFDGTAAQPPCR